MWSQVENNMDRLQQIKTEKEFEELIKKYLSKYLQSTGFVVRKLTDTPNDGLQVVNRNYVTLNGTVANRPVSSVAVIGQSYFATDTNIPMTYSAGGWRNGSGSIVALNN